MPKLTDTQFVILSAASKRSSGAILPLSKTLKASKGGTASSLKSLIKRGLIVDRPVAGNAAPRREAEDGAHLSLVITDAGLMAIGIDPVEAHADAEPAVQVRRAAKKATPTEPGRQDKKQTINKQTLLLDLLHRPYGASITELGAALGWQAHSVRGVIAGMVKKKLGLQVTSEKTDGRGRVYHIAINTIATKV